MSRTSAREGSPPGAPFPFTHTAASTGGELLAFDFALCPGGAVPIPHVHPVQTERFEVVDGLMSFRIGLRKIEAGPGDVVEVAPGVAHSFANAGDTEAQLRVEVRPALAMEEMFAEVVAMARAGRMNRRGTPRNMLDLVVLAHRYDQDAHAALLSARVQDAEDADTRGDRQDRPPGGRAPDDPRPAGAGRLALRHAAVRLRGPLDLAARAGGRWRVVRLHYLDALPGAAEADRSVNTIRREAVVTGDAHGVLAHGAVSELEVMSPPWARGSMRRCRRP